MMAPKRMLTARRKPPALGLWFEDAFMRYPWQLGASVSSEGSYKMARSSFCSGGIQLQPLDFLL